MKLEPLMRRYTVGLAILAAADIVALCLSMVFDRRKSQ